MKKIFLKLIRLYQKTAFFRKPIFKTLWLSDAACRFQPTCSEYCFEALNKYGMIRGCFKGLLRIVRCNPWNKGGLDPLV